MAEGLDPAADGDSLTSRSGAATLADRTTTNNPALSDAMKGLEKTTTGERFEPLPSGAPSSGMTQQAGTNLQTAGMEVAVDTSERTDASAAREPGLPRGDVALASTTLTSPTTASASPASPTSATAQLQAALGSAHWGREFGEQIATMTLRGEQQVSLHLNPRELGPLVIEVAMVNNQAQLQFLANQQSVRAAVEQALPELREIFEQQGLTLGDTNVSDHRQRDGSAGDHGLAGSEAQSSSTSSAGAPLPSELPLPASAALEQASGRVDLYI